MKPPTNLIVNGEAKYEVLFYLNLTKMTTGKYSFPIQFGDLSQLKVYSSQLGIGLGGYKEHVPNDGMCMGVQ